MRQRFRVYLLGQPFKLVTDCKAFTMTLQKKDLVTKVSRWAMFLEEFDYTVEHRRGSRMQHVDALSPSPTVMMALKDDLLVRLRKVQKEDERINAIGELLRSGPYKDYIMENGI